MVRVYLPSPPGETRGINSIIAAIRQYQEHLIGVLRVVNRSENKYTFIAMFREPNTIGGFIALISQNAATSGYNGGGPAAHAAILTFLDDTGIEFEDRDWSEWEADYSDFTAQITDPDAAVVEIADAWSDFLSSYIWYFLPRESYKPSEERLREVTS